MRYALAVLTHGDSEPLEATLRSYIEHVTPAPEICVCVRDGGGKLPPFVGQSAWDGMVLVPQRGFCEATGALWKRVVARAAQEEIPYVFWLEHDFLFTRDVNLAELARTLDAFPKLAQLALMRQPVNPLEIACGGVIERHRDAGSYFLDHDGWISHSVYFTTNPSLMRTAFMAENPWREDHTECEGRYGYVLRQFGFDFGIWGDGTPWVEHVGVRDGFGY